MFKYITAMCLITAMGLIISVIGMTTGDGIRPRHPVDNRPDENSEIYAAGIVEGATQDIELRFEQAGRVNNILVKEGRWVHAGDVLVRLDSERQQQQVALARAKLDLSKAELERLQNGARSEERDEAVALTRAAETRVEQAVRNLELFQSLRGDRAVTKQEVDDQQSLTDTSRSELSAARAREKFLEAPARADEKRAAEARVAAAEAELQLAKIGLSKTELRAPCDGRVLDIHTEIGELTGPEAAQPLVILSDTSTIRVRAFVEELDAPRVRLGMSALVTVDGLPNQSFRGRVTTISPRMAKKSLASSHADEIYDTKVREVVVELSGAARLILGLRVDVTFDVDQQGNSTRGT